MHNKQVKGILSASNGMNIYRGCTHGCIYCDSRSHCYNMQHDFEDIEVKINAPELLRETLLRKRKKCMISTGAMCDPYIHLEEKLKHTRKCVEIIEELGFGLSIQTKSDRILRDLELLKSINRKTKCVVETTLTTFDEELCRIIEPNVTSTRGRFEMLKIMRDNGIPTVVWIDPMLPFINDTEENLQGILGYCLEAKVQGIICFGIGMTLRDGSRDYFYKKLDEHFPGMKHKYQKKYGNSYELKSDNSEILRGLFEKTCVENGILCDNDKVFEYLKYFDAKPDVEQLSLL